MGVHSKGAKRACLGQLLTPDEVSDRFKIPKGTLKQYRYRGIGPNYFKPAGRVLYDSADVEQWIKSAEHVPSVRATQEEVNVAL